MKTTDIDILLVEDNIHEAQLTIMSLEEHRLSTNLFHVEDGAEALDFLFAKRKYEARHECRNPKFILLDLKLPKVNGLGVLKEIKSNDRTKSIPVVIFSSSAEDRDIIEGYELGVNSYIVKPVDFHSFAKAIGDLGAYWALLNIQPIQ